MHLKPAMEIRTSRGHLVGLIDDPIGPPLRTVVNVCPREVQEFYRGRGDISTDSRIIPITLQRVEYQASRTLVYDVWLISDDDVDRLPGRGYARRIDARLLERC